MGQLDKLESILDENLNKKAPVKLPADWRKAIVANIWWVALVVGLLQLWAVWELWDRAQAVSEFAYYANNVSRAMGVSDAVDGPNLLFHLATILMAGSALAWLLASPALKEGRKMGWDMLFYGLLLNLGYGVARMFSGHGGGFDDLLWAVVTFVIGAYVLFQVRDRFTDKGAAHKAEAAHEPKAEKKEEK
jgi:hypothetical protein